MKSFKDMRNQIDEVLKKSDDISKWISDFIDSDAPQFKGKSKEERIKMAKGAYYAAQRNEEMKCWDGYRKQGTKIGRSGKVVNNCVKEEELDESTEALKKKAEKSGVSLSILKKVYARGVAAWNSGHRPGTTPQQWGMARVNSYITKGKGTYHGADKDLREQDESHPYHKGLSKSTIAKRKAHWNKKDKLSDKDPKAYEPAPGDANAKTKESKHTKKYKELYGEMTNKPQPNMADLEKNASLSKKDKGTLGKIHSLMAKQKQTNKKPKDWAHALATEEADQIDEISKKTLASYVHHAAHDAGIKRIMSTDFYHQGDKARKKSKKDASYSLAQQYRDKARKRVDNIGKAAQKLAKEEVLDELSKVTLKSYANKAHQAADDHEYDAEHQYNDKKEQEKSRQMAAKRRAGAAKADAKLAKEAVNPEAAAKESKKAQMTAKHASEKEALAKKHAREKESMKESTASKVLQTKLSSMDRMKNVRIPTPAERRAEIEKRKQMKEDTTMLSFDDYLEEDMRIAKASKFAKQHAGDMKTAVKKIEALRKGLVHHPKVKDALKKANEELTDKQKKLDHNKNGKIDGEDLAKLRSKQEGFASDAQRKAVWASKNEKKMKEEVEEIDELSKKTLGSYVKKASFNAAQAAYQAGGSNGNIAKLSPHMDKLNKRTAGVNKATDKLTKEEVEIEEESYTPKSYKDFMNEMDSSKRYVHKGTRYGGSAQHDDERESDFGRDYEDKEKYKQRLFGKTAKKKPAETPVKRGRGRPSGSKSGARDYYNRK